MVNICVICMVREGVPLSSVNGEARELLEAVVSPFVDMYPLRHTQLLACDDCHTLLKTVQSFQKTALIGLKNLLSLPYYQDLFPVHYLVTPVERSVTLPRQPRCSRPRLQPLPPLQPLSAAAPTAAGPSSNPPPLLFQIMGPPLETSPGAWTPVPGPPRLAPASAGATPTLLVTPLVPTSTAVAAQVAPALPGPRSEYNEDGASEDPLSVPIKTEEGEVSVEIDLKLEIEPEPETLREQLTHEVDIKVEPDAGDPAGSPSATDSASDFEDDIPRITVMKTGANDKQPMPHELATPDEPLITTFTHTPQRPTHAYKRPRSDVDNIEETLRSLPKLPKLTPRPPPAARGAVSSLPRRPPPITQLESSVQAMEAQMPSFSRSVAGVAGRAPELPRPDPPDQQSLPQSWYVRVLPDEEVSAAREAARAAPEFAGARYKCHACLLAFRCETGRALHDRTHHPFADGRYQCRTCGHREGEVDAWRAHVRTHYTRYCCCYCPFSTGDVAVIKQHYCEPKLQQWERTNFVKGLFEEKERAQKKPLPEKCAKCYSRFADKAKLERHQERMHSKPEVPRTCKICNKQFKNRTKLYNHTYLHRKQEQLSRQPELRARQYCAECDRGFDTPSAYRTHQLSVKHSGRDHWKHECDECGRVFATKYRVRQHIQIVHLKQLNYKCALCPARLCTASRLRRHERSHGPQARPHVCHLCGKTYTVKKTLREHLLAHAGLRPHACKLCPATFTYSAALFTHHRLKHLKLKMTWKKRPRKPKKENAPTDKKGKAERTKKMTKKTADDQCVT